MKWAKSLKIDDKEPVEKRLLNIISHLAGYHKSIDCVIFFIDATGSSGSSLTQELNEVDHKRVDFDDLIAILKEDGQVFDLHLLVKAANDFEIYIVDGSGIDILGDGPELPLTVIGEHIDVDVTNYNY